MNKKPSTDRVVALRERRAALGLVRIEHYVHSDDKKKLSRYAERLNKNRFSK